MVCQCTLLDFLLHLEDPKKLVKSRWRIFGPKCYVAYRLILATYTLITLVVAIIYLPQFALIYFTTWGYIVMTLNFFVKAVVVLKYFHWLHIIPANSADETVPLIPRSSPDKIPHLLQFSWLLSNIATTIGITISVIFWSILFPGEEIPADFGTIQVHGINTVLLITDLIISSKPHRMAHLYQPVAYGLAYLSFSSLYWAAGGRNPQGTKAIYPFIKWDDGAVTSVGTLGSLGISTVVHAVVVGIAKLRDYGLEGDLIADKNNSKPNEQSEA